MNYMDDYEEYLDYLESEKRCLNNLILNANKMENLVQTIRQDTSSETTITINKSIDKPYIKMLNDNIDKLCIQKHGFSKSMIRNSISIMQKNDQPTVLLIVTHKITKEIIGFCQIIAKLDGMTDFEQIYDIEISYLCGSIYPGIGKILIQFAKQIASHFNVQISVEAYTTSKGFYEKMGFKCINHSMSLGGEHAVEYCEWTPE